MQNHSTVASTKYFTKLGQPDKFNSARCNRRCLCNEAIYYGAKFEANWIQSENVILSRAVVADCECLPARRGGNRAISKPLAENYLFTVDKFHEPVQYSDFIRGTQRQNFPVGVGTSFLRYNYAFVQFNGLFLNAKKNVSVRIR